MLGGNKPAQPTALPNDAVPSSYTSYEESEAQRPSWSDGALQVQEPEAIFAAASASSPGQLAQALLLCKVQLINAGGFDIGSDPDPRTTITLSSGRTINHFVKNRLSFYVSAPLVTLQTGDSISLLIVDDDERVLGPTTESDGIASLSITAEGAPSITGSSAHAEIECVTLTNKERLESFVAIALDKADQEIVRAYSFVGPPDKAAIDSKRQNLQYKLAGIAALVGWADPRVQARWQKLNGELESYWQSKLPSAAPAE